MEQKFSFKKLLSVFLVCAMLLSSFTFLAFAEEATNVALGKTYTTSDVYPEGSDATYADEGGITLTDGVEAVADATYSSPLWVGFHKSLGAVIVVDLEDEYLLDKFVVAAAANLGAGINVPSTISVRYSNDKEAWTDAGTADFAATEATTAYATLTLTEAVTARYVEFTVTEGYGNWIFVSEVAAYGEEAEEEPEAKNKFTIELSDNDGILNKTVDEAIDLLTDGDWVLDAGAWGTGTANVVPFQNKNATNVNAYGQINLIYEFAETPEPYNNIKLGLYSDVNVMMGYPSEEDVFFSNDGVNWVGGYSNANIGYGETIPDAMTKFDGEATPAGTVIAELKLRNPQTYKFVKVELYFPKSPFTVDNGYAAESAKPRWEFFGVTEFEIGYTEPSSVITDFNITEYWESRYGRGKGSFAFTTADAYAVAWDNFITSGYTYASFAPVEGLENVYEVVSKGAASGDVAFSEGGFIWVAYSSADAGSYGKAALDLFATMEAGDQYTFTGIDFEKSFGEKDAKIEKYEAPVEDVPFWSEGEYELDDSGNWNPYFAWGYEFAIDSFNATEGAATAIFDNATDYAAKGPGKWTTQLLLAPVAGQEGVYEVIAAYKTTGKKAQANLDDGTIDFNDGKIVLSVQDAGTRPEKNDDGTLKFPNWEDRAASWGLINTLRAKLTLNGSTLTVEEKPTPVISGWGATVDVMTDGYTGLGEITGYEGNNDKIYGFGNDLVIKAEYDFTIAIEETKFDAITLYALDYAGGAVMLPESVKFVVGETTYDAVITANAGGIATIKAELDEAITASEIKVEVVMGVSPYAFGIFNMFTELEVNEVEEPIPEPDDSVNVLLGVAFDKLTGNYYSYGDAVTSGAELTDGYYITEENLDGPIYKDDNVAGFGGLNKSTLELEGALNGTFAINKIVVHYANGKATSGICEPATIKAFYKNGDGEWIQFGETFTSTETDENMNNYDFLISTVTFTVDTAVEATDIRFEMSPRSGKSMVFISELEAWGTEVEEVSTEGTKEDPAVIEILNGFRGYMGEGYATLKGGDEYYFTAILPVDGDVNAQFYVFDEEYNNYAVSYSLNGGELLDSYTWGNPGLDNLKAGDVVTIYVKVADDAPEVSLTAMISLDAVGSNTNPAEVEAGDIETVLDDMTFGYTYEYVAPADGTVTVTMADQEGGWVYSVNIEAAGIYGDMHYSDDDPIVKSESFEVKAGDVLTIAISTYGGMTSAGTVKWNLKFEEPKPDVVELLVSHVNAYNWGTFEAMIISGDGKTVEEVINQKPQWWIVYTVENIDGKYVATSFLKNSEECYQVKVPTGGFLFYVFDANSAYAAADNGALLDYTFVLGSISLEGVTAIDTSLNAAKVLTAYAPGVEIPEPIPTSKVVNAFNIGHYSEGSEGANGAYIFTDADKYGTGSGYAWWRQVALAPVEGEEGLYKAVAITEGSGGTSGGLTIPEGGFIWVAFEWPEGAETSGTYALGVMNTLSVGSYVEFTGIDIENCTTTADATAVKSDYVDPDAPVNVALDKKYEISGIGNRESYYGNITDGSAVMNLNGDNHKNWFGFYNNGNAPTNAPDKVGYFIIDLEKVYDIDTIKVGLIQNVGWGIAGPASVKAYGSLDGETFEEIGTFEFSLEDGVGIWTEITAEAQAQYIKIEVTLAGTFAFVNEVEVYGEEAPVAKDKLTINLSDNEQYLNLDAETVIDLLTDGDWALNAEGWGGKHDGVVLIQNKNATNSGAFGEVEMIWEFAETPEAYNTIRFGLYTDVNSMIGYPTEDDVYFSNDGVEWVSGYYTLGYGETIPDAVYGGDNQTAPGTVVAEIKLENPQNYKFVKIVLGFPKSPFAEKPRWEFFGLTEVFEFDCVETSSVITDFNITEYWESRYGRGAGSFAFTTADAYAVAWDNFISTSYTLVSFAPVEGFENVYEVVSNGAASGDVAFPEGGFIWTAYNSAEEGSFGKAALDLFATMTVGDTYEFTGFDFAGEFVQADATVEKWTAPVEPKPEISGWGAGVEVMTDGYTGLGEITGYEGNNDKIYGFGNNLTVKAEYDFTITIEEAKFDAITLYALDYLNGCVTLPESVQFVVNGKTYDAVITANENGIATIKAELGEEVTASEIKVLVVMGESPFTFGIFNMFTELTVDVVETKPTALLGDVNGNGEIDKYDYILVKRQIMNTIVLTDEQAEVADVNGNGEIDKYDYILIKRHIMGTFVIGE